MGVRLIPDSTSSRPIAVARIGRGTKPLSHPDYLEGRVGGGRASLI